MTEAEQDREIGAMVRERQALVTQQVCLCNKARVQAKALQHFVNVLTAAADREKWAHPGYDGYPSVEEVQEVLTNSAETARALRTVDEGLNQLGIKPRGW